MELINLSGILPEETELCRLGIPLPPYICMASLKQLAAPSASCQPQLAASSTPGSPSACLLFPSRGCCLGGLQHSLMPPLWKYPLTRESHPSASGEGHHCPWLRRANGSWLHHSTSQLLPLSSCPLSWHGTGQSLGWALLLVHLHARHGSGIPGGQVQLATSCKEVVEGSHSPTLCPSR